jgi:transcriptional regulator with XRE-family HTH domain
MPPEAHRELRSFGECVRRCRVGLGLSQEKFAEHCGLHRTYIGQVERGEKNISFVNILRIATALKTTPSKLFDSSSL